jgi:hypothetical protein
VPATDDHDAARAGEASAVPPIEGAPSDNTTLMSVLDDMASQGFDGHVVVAEDAMLECGCGERLAPGEVVVERRRRLEGASDPDDLLLVLAVRCPRCRRAGTLVMGYGPNATAAESSVARALPRTHGDPDDPGV